MWIKKALLKFWLLRMWEKALLSLALFYGIAPALFLLSLFTLAWFASNTVYHVFSFIAWFSVGLSLWILRIAGFDKPLVIIGNVPHVNFDVLALLTLLNFTTVGVIVVAARGVQILLKRNEERKGVAAQRASSSRGHDYWGSP